MPILVSHGTGHAAGVSAKICGLSRPEDLHACRGDGMGARYVGFVFFEKSPRNVSVAQARALALEVPVGTAKVALVVDASDDAMDAITSEVPLDMLQLHGKESPERVAEIRARYSLPVMKAVGVAEEADLANVHRYAEVVDQLLIDAKPPKGADLPGGNGLAFDWSLLAGRQFSVPWMLAGGLTPENVAEAITRTGARQVDVSSGVESAPGVKDPAKIRAFLKAVSSAS